MNASKPSVHGSALLANGAAGRWLVEIDRSVEDGRLFTHIDGPSFYLYFELESTAVIEKSIDLLQGRQTEQGGIVIITSSTKVTPPASELVLGKCGSMPVTLALDDESPDRCFLTVGDDSSATIQITVADEDFSQLTQSLVGVQKQLRQEDRFSMVG